MNKLERDGKVAVVISKGFGSGWGTNNCQKFRETLCMDAEIAQAVLDGDMGKAVELATKKCDEHIWTGGADDLVVEWVPKGAQFEIDEYDGSESIHVIGSRQYMTA